MVLSSFAGRSLLIATQHKKEVVIAPILERELGVRCSVVSGLDTDRLGTFSGEVERQADPITTARKKCMMATELTPCDLVLASEGSFGPHPHLCIVPADDEVLLLIDRTNDLEIVARELSTETNYAAAELKSLEELNRFAERAKFPSHGLILRKAQDDFSSMVKGITSQVQLKEVFVGFVDRFGSAYVETDMRGMHNPTRMKVIERTVHKLVDKAKSICPKCLTPGFEVAETRAGLPCEVCGFPTRGTLSFIYGCKRCSHKTEQKYPQGRFTEDPMYCDICNP